MTTLAAGRFFSIFGKWQQIAGMAFLALALQMPSQAVAVGSGQLKVPTRAKSADTGSLLGSYLAGRIARSSRDAESAALFYQKVLASDPTNQEILDEVFQLELAAGNVSQARHYAQKLIQRQKNSTVARLFLGIEAFKRKEYAKAAEHFKIAGRAAPSEPTIKLALAWTLLAQGKTDAAIKTLDSPSKAAWATHFETVQRAFIADVGGRKAEADAAYKAVYDAKTPNTRIAESYARHLVRWGDRAGATKLLTDSGAASTPMGKVLMEELNTNKPIKLMASSVDEGLSEVFLGIGQVLVTNNGVDAAHIYLRLALYLNPQSQIAIMEMADFYANIDQHDKANAILDGIKEGAPFWLNAQIRKALNLNATQKIDAAVGLLTALLEKYPTHAQILETIASIEAARKNYTSSIPYYSRAIALVDKPEKKHWGLFYARGIAYERSKQWDKAEPDFKRSLELDPEQGVVLNYLGYSWIDQNLNVPEAFEMIKKAVRLRPNDGYIIDSLGWAYYVQKDYEQAVKYCERAVELRPEDATLNDHLGDAYWRVGRKIEARFQWEQALTLNPEPEDAARIKRKIERGGLEDEPAAGKDQVSTATDPAAKRVEPMATATTR